MDSYRELSESTGAVGIFLRLFHISSSVLVWETKIFNKGSVNRLFKNRKRH